MTREPGARPSKREAFLSFLADGWVSVHLDARRDGVVVPDNLRGEKRLVLQYGRDMPMPIPDLEVTESGVLATLSFQRMPQRTVVPWSAVYIIACTDGRGVLYQEDVPNELAAMAKPARKPLAEEADDADEPEAGGTEAPAAAEAPSRRHLSSVPLVPEGDDMETNVEANDGEDGPRGEGDATKAPRHKRPVLRLIK